MAASVPPRAGPFLWGARNPTEATFVRRPKLGGAKLAEFISSVDTFDENVMAVWALE